MCTMHTCDVQSLGYKKPVEGHPVLEAQKWTQNYYELRSEIEVEEMRLMGHSVDL